MESLEIESPTKAEELKFQSPSPHLVADPLRSLGKDIENLRLSEKPEEEIKINGYIEKRHDDEIAEDGRRELNGGADLENTGREVGADLEKYETVWVEDGDDLRKDAVCYDAEENKEWSRCPSVPIESTGWDDDVVDGKLEQRFEPAGDGGNNGWEEQQFEAAGDSGSKGREDIAGFQNEGLSEYPQRPGALACSYYLRFGNCKFRSSCKFNHPPDQKPNQFPSMRGGNKSGSACDNGHHYHSSEKTETGVVELNFSGLPLRPGGRECPYYMRTGSCKFSTNCRYHHPDPTAIAGQDLFSGYDNGGSPQQLALGASKPPEFSQPFQETSNEHAPFLKSSGSYFPAMLFPPHGIRPTPNINTYQAPVNALYSSDRNIHYPSASVSNGHTSMAYGPTLQQAEMKFYSEIPSPFPYPTGYGDTKFRSAANFHHPSASNSNGHATSAGSPNHQFQQMEEYPQRPGQQECQYFMKHGDCKFKTACKYHHPLALTSHGPTPKVAAGFAQHQAQMDEYPPRFGERDCPYFMKNGNCKYGDECKFRHPSAPTLNGLTGKGYSQKVEYPEKPGEQECSFYMRFGDCKFRSACKFHHPKSRLPVMPTCDVSSVGLPLRPDQPLCLHFSRFGICKFGPSCMYDHSSKLGYLASEVTRSPSQVSSPEEIRIGEDKIVGNDTTEQEQEW